MSSSSDIERISPVELLQRLIRFDTTNPPGAELDCILYICDLLEAGGFECTLVSKDAGRPNLVARLPGRGEAPPLLLHGHVDVVPTAGQKWTHDPFAGDLADGCVWGRGALDMKGGLAMMITALLDLASLGPPAGDLILAVFSDEETGSSMGADFVTREHPELFAGVRYAIGEGGGFSLTLQGKRIYFVHVDEKVRCGLTATVRGRGGHAALDVRGRAMGKLAHLLTTLDENLLPAHLDSPTQRLMVEGIARVLGTKAAFVEEDLKERLRPGGEPLILDDYTSFFRAITRNTATPTMLSASVKDNVVPDAISVRLDARLMPGQKASDLVREMQDLVGPDVELEADLEDIEAQGEADLTMLPEFERVLLTTHDRTYNVVPFLLPGGTDGRFFRKLGIQPYGFIPVRLPEGLNRFELMHGVDERLPVETIEFGTAVLRKLLATKW